jgi:hypothetical protein
LLISYTKGGFVNIGKILAKVGTAVISNIVPGAGIVIDAVNAFLPDEKKLPADATGQQTSDAINSLPVADQVTILSKQLDVEIIEAQEYTKVISALAEADKTGSSTRPQIALMMAKVTSFAIIISVSVWAYAVVLDLSTMMVQLKASWPLLMAILGPPIALLRAYFAMRTKEKRARYNIGAGQSESNGLLNDIIGVFRK